MTAHQLLREAVRALLTEGDLAHFPKVPMKYTGPSVPYRDRDHRDRHIRAGMTVFVDKATVTQVLASRDRLAKISVYRSENDLRPVCDVRAMNLRPRGGKGQNVVGLPEGDDYTVVRMKPHCSEENCDMGEALFTCPSCGEESYDANLWYNRDNQEEDIQHVKCHECGADFDVHALDMGEGFQWIIPGKFERDPWV